MKFEIDEEKIYKHYWSKERIEGYAKRNNSTFLEALLYLYFFNYVSVSNKDQSENLGREMYKKFASGTARFLRGDLW